MIVELEGSGPAPQDEGGRYGTHLRALEKALNASHGPVLECGMGDHSTPFLEAYCAKHRRELVSGESDDEWIQKYAENKPGLNHDIIKVPLAACGSPDWNLFPWGYRRWSVALVDMHPSAARLVAISALWHNADFIVVHDTEQQLYFYQPIFQCFKYVSTDKTRTPWTTVLSNLHYLPLD